MIATAHMRRVCILLALVFALTCAAGVTTTALASEENTESSPPTLDAPAFPFADVGEDDWFFSDVKYVFENGLTTGTSADRFSPGASVTRGMVVTVLYRLEGEPGADGLENPFGDLAEGAYYVDAVVWAAENGVVLGYDDGTFRPDRPVTREQLAVFIHRYELFTEASPPDIRAGKAFADGNRIGAFAETAVAALYRQGVVEGRSGDTFAPKGEATRAEFAVVLRRYMEGLPEKESPQEEV